MRIGILTYHAVYNFGANLQALSTFCYLKKAGHNPVVIDFFPEKLEEAFKRSVPNVQAEAHKRFIRNNFTLTGRCRNSAEVAGEIMSNNIDAVIIGSDAVVQHFPLASRIKVNPSRKSIISVRIDPVNYETNFPNPFWGEFIDHLNTDIPVSMMSVSCQNTDYKLFAGKEKKAINDIVQKIRYISVRDERTQDLFRFISDGKIVPVVTPDPVFAFNDNVPDIPSRSEIVKKFGLPDKYILLSFNLAGTVNELWTSEFQTIAMKNGFDCVALAMPGGIKFRNKLIHKIDIPIDPLEWYGIIKYSSAYIGEKMHPVIVSLHNTVPFFSFDHYGILRFRFFLEQRSSKIYQILQKAGIQDNRISIRNKITYRTPSPLSVFKKIDFFDREHCSDFAGRMTGEYKLMMERLLNSLKPH